jgi:ubiquinone/menaquinone biosynthesis C-methylase UbiE
MLVNDAATICFDFGKIASRYDAWYRTPRGAMYDRLEKRAIDGLLPSASDGDRLLDIGCGTGHFSEHFASRGFAVTGVDISESMIAIARQKTIGRSAFAVADAERLPVADETFDVAAAITVLEFVSDPARVVSEMVRCVKKPGGLLILGVLNRLSAYNRTKQRKGIRMYALARLLAPADLRDVLRPYGAPEIRVAGFVPREDAFIWLSPLLEWIGRLTGDQHGAFLAAKVKL